MSYIPESLLEKEERIKKQNLEDNNLIQLYFLIAFFQMLAVIIMLILINTNLSDILSQLK